MTLQTLHEILAAEGLAMSNVGSISDTSIAGVISTGTHGSGIKYGCLATHVLALEIMLADSSRVRCSRSENSDLFLASLCGLGATGLILRVTLQVERAFRLKETRQVLHIDDVIRDIERLAVSGEYVRLWWSPHTDQVSVMSANRTFEVCIVFRTLVSFPRSDAPIYPAFARSILMVLGCVDCGNFRGAATFHWDVDPVVRLVRERPQVTHRYRVGNICWSIRQNFKRRLRIHAIHYRMEHPIRRGVHDTYGVETMAPTRAR